MELTTQAMKRARLSRDPRFDGLFFIAVKTTGIYCRTICPAVAPKEDNVQYYSTAHHAALAGFRPCLRCRPDAAPGVAFKSSKTDVAERAKARLDAHYTTLTMAELATSLGYSTRFVSSAFNRKFGLSPKAYQLFLKCQFAKKLLQETSLTNHDVAAACGVGSARRLQGLLQSKLQLSPSEIRRKIKEESLPMLTCTLAYRPPYAKDALIAFLQKRLITGLEWQVKDGVGRTFSFNTSEGEVKGWYQVQFNPNKHCLDVAIHVTPISSLSEVLNKIRALFDLDAEPDVIDRHLERVKNESGLDVTWQTGLRVPGIMTEFEAMMRAILGQQVSVAAATKLVTQLVHELGEQVQNPDLPKEAKGAPLYYFPTPQQVSQSDLAFFKMPARRKAAILAVANWFYENQPPYDLDALLDIKGIGPWTVDYAKMRGQHHPDIYLGGDLGVQKALKNQVQPKKPLSQADLVKSASPFNSYLTFQLWQQL